MDTDDEWHVIHIQCLQDDPLHLAPLATGDGVVLFRCGDCLAGMPACASCMCIAHQQWPLQAPEEWNGCFWKRARLAICACALRGRLPAQMAQRFGEISRQALSVYPPPSKMAPGCRNEFYFDDDDLPDSQNLLADHSISISQDGLQTVSGLMNLRGNKQTRLTAPNKLANTYADWTPVQDDSDDDTNFSAIADTVTSYDVSPDVNDADVLKRKCYKSLDQPMSLWRPLKQFFLESLLCCHGLGNYTAEPACAFCDAKYGDGAWLFRCLQCGNYLQCKACVLGQHATTPLHTFKEWNGAHWTEATLTQLEFVYQMGHHGLPCDFPKPEERLMVVMDVTGVHTLQYRYCKCERQQGKSTLHQVLDNGWYPATITDPDTCATFAVLDHFRLLNVVGNVNVHDYVGVLERLTDPLRMGSVPDHYKGFGRMSRQYTFLLRAERAGRAHKENGIQTTKPGGLAVTCWPCPQDGRNMPEGWRDVKPKYQFLYMLLLAMDANSRLKNRLWGNEHQDPSLGSGLRYFVEERGFKEHIKNYVAEKDVSTCIVFAALLQKETWLTTGLRCLGVGGCVCARQGVVRPQGLGDLQKGERYANMDYIFLSALIGVTVLWLMISYDIACQWQVHLLPCAKKIKETTTVPTDLDQFEIQFALPVWHAAAHKASCQTQNSLSYAAGVGRTDGERIERTWAVLNPLGFSTKEMGYGARHDAIEDRVDHLNFEKNVSQGDTLARKLIVAIAERDKQVEGFCEVDRTLSSRLRIAWEKRITDWLVDKTQPNPYCLEGGKGAGPTEAAVFLELKTAEALEVAEGREHVDMKSTALAFIRAGLQLEQAQLRIKVEVKGVTLITANQASEIQEM
ncbi:hypothetical protein B0H17DRAFT_1211182 [Mycena rosella]|uniref:CxC2-like cysteine cluster KDZ transposase-associated domain-containing protein n=1 Tax=Mycena rosella TaxID=1033263 RepID=A0AAD7CUV8_MYCRO|nr:hypothetical protein B0H17DRAFT_1211182 [Mycena rosella]